VGLRSSFYHDRGYDIDAPHDTEIKPRICKKADNESAYNESPALTKQIKVTSGNRKKKGIMGRINHSPLNLDGLFF
jgi:hypothetical protein